MVIAMARRRNGVGRMLSGAITPHTACARPDKPDTLDSLGNHHTNPLATTPAAVSAGSMPTLGIVCQPVAKNGLGGGVAVALLGWLDDRQVSAVEVVEATAREAVTL